MNCTCPRLEASPTFSIVQHTPDCPKNKNKARFGVRKYKLRGGPTEYQPREIRVIGGLEGEVAENPIYKDSLYVAKLGSDEVQPERGRQYAETSTGFGEWMHQQDILGKKLGFEPGLEETLRTLDKCGSCHKRPVRRGTNGQYLRPLSPRLCKECYLVRHRKRQADWCRRHRLMTRTLVCHRCKGGIRNPPQRLCPDCLKKASERRTSEDFREQEAEKTRARYRKRKERRAIPVQNISELVKWCKARYGISRAPSIIWMDDEWNHDSGKKIDGGYCSGENCPDGISHGPTIWLSKTAPNPGLLYLHELKHYLGESDDAVCDWWATREWLEYLREKERKPPVKRGRISSCSNGSLASDTKSAEPVEVPLSRLTHSQISEFRVARPSL